MADEGRRRSRVDHVDVLRPIPEQLRNALCDPRLYSYREAFKMFLPERDKPERTSDGRKKQKAARLEVIKKAHAFLKNRIRAGYLKARTTDRGLQFKGRHIRKFDRRRRMLWIAPWLGEHYLSLFEETVAIFLRHHSRHDVAGDPRGRHKFGLTDLVERYRSLPEKVREVGTAARRTADEIQQLGEGGRALFEIAQSPDDMQGRRVARQLLGSADTMAREMEELASAFEQASAYYAKTILERGEQSRRRMLEELVSLYLDAAPDEKTRKRLKILTQLVEITLEACAKETNYLSGGTLRNLVGKIRLAELVRFENEDKDSTSYRPSRQA